MRCTVAASTGRWVVTTCLSGMGVSSALGRGDFLDHLVESHDTVATAGFRSVERIVRELDKGLRRVDALVRIRRHTDRDRHAQRLIAVDFERAARDLTPDSLHED